MKKGASLIFFLSIFLIIALYGVMRTYFTINPAQCDGCGECLISCPENAIYFDQELQIMRIDADLCSGCGECLNWCPHSAIQLADSTAFLVGRVIANATGFPVRNAMIQVDSFMSVSDFYGEYCLNLPAGQYDVTCQAEGYIVEIAEDINLSDNEIAGYDFCLLYGNSAELETLSKMETSPYFSPNPFRENTHFLDFPVNQTTSDYSLRIYNVKGQLIKQFYAGSFQGNSLSWNGRDNNQQKLAAGIYLYEMTAGNKKYIGKLSCLPD
ncbi:MAG: 4Fe-4S binding protein [Candidatus Cloacimonetes bacterium]|nr:4Fe-4S binding protein [Candidatus Cloacimonadota bacterium]